MCARIKPGGGGIWTIGEKIENHLAVPIGKGGDCGQWVRKIWIWPNISLHWCALLCSQGWDIFSWAGWTEGETMLSSQHHPAGRISQGPRVSGPEAILTQLPVLIRASDGNKQARGISQGPWLPILILICAKKIWLSLESNVSHNYHRHHWVESHIP